MMKISNVLFVSLVFSVPAFSEGLVPKVKELRRHTLNSIEILQTGERDEAGFPYCFSVELEPSFQHIREMYRAVGSGRDWKARDKQIEEARLDAVAGFRLRNECAKGIMDRVRREILTTNVPFQKDGSGNRFDSACHKLIFQTRQDEVEFDNFKDSICDGVGVVLATQANFLTSSDTTVGEVVTTKLKKADLDKRQIVMPSILKSFEAREEAIKRTAKENTWKDAVEKERKAEFFKGIQP